MMKKQDVGVWTEHQDSKTSSFEGLFQQIAVQNIVFVVAS